MFTLNEQVDTWKLEGANTKGTLKILIQSNINSSNNNIPTPRHRNTFLLTMTKQSSQSEYSEKMLVLGNDKYKV